jgi:hypothetical protein
LKYFRKFFAKKINRREDLTKKNSRQNLQIADVSKVRNGFHCNQASDFSQSGACSYRPHSPIFRCFLNLVPDFSGTLTPSPTSFSAWTPARSSFRRRFSARFLRNRCPDRSQNPDSPRLPQPKAVVPSFPPRKPSTTAGVSPQSPLPQSQPPHHIGSPRFFQYSNVQQLLPE